MIKIRYLSLAVLLLSAAALWGQDDFNPPSPEEPGVPPVALVLNAEPADGGTVSGGGKFVPGKTVTVRASAKTNFKFVNWATPTATVSWIFSTR